MFAQGELHKFPRKSKQQHQRTKHMENNKRIKTHTMKTNKQIKTQTERHNKKRERTTDTHVPRVYGDPQRIRHARDSRRTSLLDFIFNWCLTTNRTLKCPTTSALKPATACPAFWFRRGGGLAPPPARTRETGRGILPWRRLYPSTQQAARRAPYPKQGQPRSVRRAPSTQEPHPQPECHVSCTWQPHSWRHTRRKSSRLLPAPPPEEARGGSAAVRHAQGDLASFVHVATPNLRGVA